MKMVTFAAIYVGSYEMELKIFELSPAAGVKEIDHVRYHLDLGRDTYDDGLINGETIDEVCQVLEDFRAIMDEYQVDHHKAYATSSVREAKNRIHILDQIRIRSGFEVEVFSNPEQRYLGYKAIAAKETDFNNIIQKGTAIVDLGGGSVQISLFDKDSLISTQNIKWGVVRLSEALQDMEALTTDLDQMVHEVIDEEIRNYKKLYLKDRNIQNIIAVCEYINFLLPLLKSEGSENFIKREDFLRVYDQLIDKSLEEISDLLNMPYENAVFILPTLVVYKRFIEVTGAELIWATGVTLSDGVAYDFAQKQKIIKSTHNFENDILAFARNISKRYMSNKSHTNQMLTLATGIFDSMKKVHGMNKRDRLLLELCVLLHDIGKYISLNNAAICSYNIIMSTEIIGLSQTERQMVANVVKFNTEEFRYYDEMEEGFSPEEYLKVAKLTAILRYVNALDTSHKQKFTETKIMLKDRKLQLTVQTADNISLELAMATDQAKFFEDVFSVRPVIKQKKFI